jgi:2-dehydropantoate 2-reductase
MKVLIIGAGAMGCRFGVFFQKGGAEVTLCDTWEEHVAALNTTGLIVHDGGVTETVRLAAVSDVKEAGAADVIVIFTKSAQTEGAVREALAAIPGDVPVMTAQNGLGNLEAIERYAGRDRMIAGVTKTATSLAGPGEIRVEGYGFLEMKALGAGAEKISLEIRDVLTAGGMEVVIPEDIMKSIWEKLVFNNAMNCVTALSRLRVGPAGNSPYGYELCGMIVREAAAVAAAEGIAVDPATVLATIRRLSRPEGDWAHITSMLADVLQERQTEIDAICGIVIRKGAAHGIPTPCLETIYNLIRLTEETYAERVGK